MSQQFSLPDSLSLDDLQVFLSRAMRVDDGSVRLIVSGSVLMVYTAVLYPKGLLDSSATVLGLRTFALAAPTSGGTPLDVVVTVRSLLDRVARLSSTVADRSAPVVVAVPIETGRASWAGISPPKSGWQSQGEADAAALVAAARAGIDEVASVIPAGTGEQIVHRVRSEVWGRPVDGAGVVPAGAAFAAFSLGFLPETEPVRLFSVGPWTRLSTSRGHILVRRQTSLG
ncbi:hypothetical protein GY21_11085 [Cryobacterium roopkundense]|uniref:Uncharacterized protein n=1 Tax=Cryobacterium roopkundense TaxID=1001240 RepID=A0A099J618_9MICO|nr:hypothetical protein [Cryobacterium roopkundense]KGJ73510.1 hypothetical protein GY21_11085 [Cryobacterium roopkundense]MBB5641529.1 hypothetical protein [Cryobacterium roopkundense]